MARKKPRNIRKTYDETDTILPATGNWGIAGRSADEEETIRGLREAFSALFGRVDSALSGREIQVQQSLEVMTAATDGETIWFNSQMIHQIFKDAVSSSSFSNGALARGLAQLRGLNYHELSHVLWSPRKGQQVFKDIVDADKTHPQLAGYVFKSYNILEDQRIESMFTSRFPASIPYLQNTVANLIVNGENSNASWLLLHGRKYMPYNIRQQAEAQFLLSYKVSDKDLKSLKETIDSFRRIILPKNSAEAMALVIKFATLMKKYFPTSDGMPDGTSAGDGGMKKGTTESISSQKETQRSLEKQDEQIEEQDEEEEASENRRHEDSEEDSDDDSDSSDGDSEDDSDDSDDDSGDSSDGSGSSDDDSDGNSSDGSDEDSDDSGSSDENSGDKNSSASRSTGVGKSQRSDDPLKKLSEELLEHNDRSLSHDLSRQIKQIRQNASDNRFKRFFEDTEEPEGMLTPPSSFRALSNALSTSLAKLKADTDNQWEHGSNIGSLNHLKKIESRGLHYDIFDQYLDDGDDRPDAEVVILLDQSSSMGTTPYDWDGIQAYNKLPQGSKVASGYIPSRRYGTSLIAEASCAAWAIKFACQSQDISCSVIGYHDSAKALLTKYDYVKRGQVPIFASYGSTHPASALRIAGSVLAKSDARYKLVVTVTDGDWFDSVSCVEEVKNLNKQGFHTLLIGLSNGVSRGKEDMLIPCYPKALEKETQDMLYEQVLDPEKGLITKQTLATIPVGYGFKSVVKAMDCKALTKTVGAVLVKGVVANR